MLTPEEKVFLIENRLEMSYRELAKRLAVPKHRVGSYLRKYEIKPPDELLNKWTAERVSEAKFNKNHRTPNTFQATLAYAKHLGYRNISEAFVDMGKQEFMQKCLAFEKSYEKNGR